MDNASVELQQFKSEINLVDYAAHCGYQVDTKKSSRKGTVMRLEADDDKILIGVTHGNRWVYHSLRDRTDKGTILDFMKRRKGLNLGEIRQELRKYTGTGTRAAWKTEPSQCPTPQPPQEIDRKAITEAYFKTKPVVKSGYLQGRGIRQWILEDLRFHRVVRFDDRRNIVFPHYDMQGLCGFELKNRGFTGFIPGGAKGVWCSCNMKTAKCLVIVEASIDALSHAQLMRTGGDTAYMSIGGQISQRQRDLIIDVLELRENITSVEIGTDDDEAGDKLADEIRGLLPPWVSVTRDYPGGEKDWNEALKR